MFVINPSVILNSDGQLTGQADDETPQQSSKTMTRQTNITKKYNCSKQNRNKKKSSKKVVKLDSLPKTINSRRSQNTHSMRESETVFKLNGVVSTSHILDFDTMYLHPGDVIIDSDDTEDEDNSKNTGTIQSPHDSDELKHYSKLLRDLKKLGSNRQQTNKSMVNRQFVSKPRKIIEGDTPQRPYPKNLCGYDRHECGTATEIFDMIFPKKNDSNHCSLTNLNLSAVVEHCDKLVKKRQAVLESYTGITEESRNRKKRLEILLNLQEILWLIHFGKFDDSLEKTFRLMILKFNCRFDKDKRLKLIKNNELSLVWNRFIELENSSIMCQRETDWKLRPVFIDGLAYLGMFSSSTEFPLPNMQTRTLLEILLHFILDGHKTSVYLPSFYENAHDHVDDIDAFQFLINSKLIRFVNERNRKFVAKQVLAEAEKTHGIVVSPMENLACLNSIHCFPIVRKSSSKIDEFLLVTCFKESSSINEKFEYEVDRTTTSIFSKAVGLTGNPLDSDVDDKKEQGEDHTSARFEETVHAESTESNLVLEMPESYSHLFEDSEKSDINELNKNETSSISDELVNNKFSHSPIATTSNTETGLDSGVGVDISDEAVGLGRNRVGPETAMQVTLGDSETYQDLARKCRLYSATEKARVKTSPHQLTLKRQVFLISSFTHLAKFNFGRSSQIKVFLRLIAQFTPELLPHFLQKSAIFEVGTAIENLKNEQDLTVWPIFSVLDSCL